jgi:hypothetical protein
LTVIVVILFSIFYFFGDTISTQLFQSSSTSNPTTEQVLKDFINVKDMVIDDGFIILHDTYPCDERMTLPNHSNDCWETILEIKLKYSDEWEYITLPFNPGLTLLKKMNVTKQILWK